MYFKDFWLNTAMSKNGWEEWQRSSWGISPAKEINRRLLDTFVLHNQFALLVSPDSSMCIEGAAAGIISPRQQPLQQRLSDTSFLQETQRKEQQ